jgi:hypothetical protein
VRARENVKFLVADQREAIRHRAADLRRRHCLAGGREHGKGVRDDMTPRLPMRPHHSRLGALSLHNRRDCVSIAVTISAVASGAKAVANSSAILVQTTRAEPDTARIVSSMSNRMARGSFTIVLTSC